MSSLTVVYSRNRSLGSILLRSADRWGQFSHCGLQTDDGFVLESVAFHGVVATSYEVFRARASKIEEKQVVVPDATAALTFAWSCVGRVKYDYSAVFGNLVRQSMDDPDRMHCAEFVETALLMGGLKRFLCPLWKVSPNISHIVL